MKRHFLRHFLNFEFAAASTIVLVLAWMFSSLSDWLPEADETSFLNPIFGRIDFLNIEDVSLDAIFAIRDMQFSDPRIYVVNIGAVAPAPDGKIAKLLYKLNMYGARVVGVDVIYDQLHFERFPKDRIGEIDLIKQAFRDNTNVVLVDGYDKTTLEPVFELDPEVRSAVRNYGFANLQKDDDEVVRRFWVSRTIGGESWLSFPIAVLEKYDPAIVRPLLALGEEQQIIAYTGSYEQFQTVPIDDVIDGDVYRSVFKDAIVLVGYVNEGGFVYLNDTHRTPMGRKVGIEGPDMAGILVHANIINMLLSGTFITPMSQAGDWTIAFIFSYLSIALYRLLRTKTTTRGGLGALISITLIIETIVAFFLPIIAFFFFQVKISYDTLAAAVLLFIPASALANKAHFVILKFRVKRRFRDAVSPLPRLLVVSFEDDESFPAHTRLVHAALTLLHYAFAVRCAERVQRGEELPAGWTIPGSTQFAELIPEIAACMANSGETLMEKRYFLKFLDGIKDQYLRESAVRELLFNAQLKNFNEFFYFEEWEVLLPHVLRLYSETLRPYHSIQLHLAERMEDGTIRTAAYPPAKSKGVGSRHLPVDGVVPGLYFNVSDNSDSATPFAPFCVAAECKLHRRRELFVFNALVPKQFGMQHHPVYGGETIACEPVLPAGIGDVLAALSTRSVTRHEFDQEEPT